MKKLFICVISLILLLSISINASALTATYATTQSFLNKMDEIGIKYTRVGIDSDGDEQITVTNHSDCGLTYTINLFFDEDLKHISIRIWNLVDFEETQAFAAYKACNSLNAKYKYTRFYVDESDWSITISYDMIINNSTTVDDICLEAILHIVDIIDVGYSFLKPFT